MRSAGLIASVPLTVLLCGGCIVHSFRDREPGPQAFTLEGVQVSEFGEDDCGAGSLATVLDYYGLPVTREGVGVELPTLDDGTVLSIDLLLAARRLGFDAQWRVGSGAQLATEITAGRPPIVMLQVVNLPGASHDYFHYAVADGVDQARALYRLHLGDGRARWVRARAIKRAWKGTDRAMLAMAPLDETRLTPEMRLTRAVTVELSGHPAEAVRRYGELLEERPHWSRVWIDMANALVTLGEPAAAKEALRTALRHEPASRDALNNLAWLLLRQGIDLDEAESLARRAADGDEPADPRVLDTLGRVLAARGKCEEAEETFRRAAALLRSPERAKRTRDHRALVEACAASVPRPGSRSVDADTLGQR